jgi:dimethylaniline monooxygenase (N-oxide forming)
MKPEAAPQSNVAYDFGAASLSVTTYIYPLLRNSGILWAYYDRFAKWAVALVSGTNAGVAKWVGSISPERYHASKSKNHSAYQMSTVANCLQVFFNKSTNSMPYISGSIAPTRSLTKFDQASFKFLLSRLRPQD